MEFFAVNGKRPVSLSETTRKFAFESLKFKYGKLARENPAVIMDDYPDFEKLSDIKRYDAMIERIALQSPIRICEGEKISGAATLGNAINHQVPATFGGDSIFDSVSHLTMDFKTVLEKGICYIESQVESSLKKFKGTEKEEFLVSCKNSVNSFKLWHNRYLEELKNKPEYENNYKNLLNVPFLPAKNFYEAVQSLWFTFAFTRLCGNWSGIGRIDWLLGDYLKNDLANGTITLNEAKEILAHFFIKGCEWITGEKTRSGDAQHYQNIILAGINENGEDVTNEVTFLVLDILEELSISDFPTTVRINRKSNEKLLKRLAEVIRYGGGVVAVYNEDLILDTLKEYGYPENEIYKFANDGCWEVQIPGKTFFGYIPFDSLHILQRETLKNYDETADFSDFDSLYNKFLSDLRQTVNRIGLSLKNGSFDNTEKSVAEWCWKKTTPCGVVSLFEEGCIERGLSYLEGGPIYNVVSPHIGGLPDAVNSLYAIKKIVFEEKKVSFKEFMKILKENWVGNEELRQYAMRKLTYYGNDNDEVDFIARDIVEQFGNMCDAINGTTPFKNPAGISTFGRQIDWSPNRLATPFGKFKNEVLAGNYSPTPGTDVNGATAIIRSYCKSDLKRMVTGAALDIKLLPQCVGGENGLQAIVSLLKGFVTLGGFFMQLDIADAELLKAAQKNPQDYETLSVRISGWNARFVTLSKEWQDMIIAQTGGEF